MAADGQLQDHPTYPSAVGPIWMMPDDDLVAAIDRMASTSQARDTAIGYYLAEFDRRQQGKATAAMLAANRTLVRLTWAILALTVVLALLAAASL